MRQVAQKAWGETAEGVSKYVDELAGEISNVVNTGTKAGSKLQEGLDIANNTLNDSITRLTSRASKKAEELDRIHRKIISQENLDPSVQSRSVMNALKERRAILDKQVKIETAQANELSSILQRSITPGKEVEALNALDSSQLQGLVNIPGVLQWKSQLQRVVAQNNRILNMTSKNLGSDTGFLQEFLSLKRNPVAADKFELWSANPHNFKKIEQLMNKDKIYDIIQKGKMSTKQKIFGITLSDNAKRVGLGIASLGAGLVSVYQWFANNDPSVVSSNANKVYSSLGTLKATGEGASLLSAARNSSKNIASMSEEITGKLSTNDSPEATMKFVRGVSKELGILVAVLEKWDIVVQNSNNPQLAQAEGKALFELVDSTSKKVLSLSRTLNIPMPSASSVSIPTATTQNIDLNNLKKIQGFLRINTTGNLDDQTINALSSLEQNFNSRAGTNEFTGAFINKNTNHIISYDNLLSAFRRIQKY